MRQVAILGLGPSRSQAPISDDAWETWGLGDDSQNLLFDRVFEMHPLDTVQAGYKKRILEQKEILGERLIQPENYPFEAIEKWWPWGWDSSPAYMLALAIHEKVPRVGLWGLHMEHHSEYEFQRENLIQMIGFARGRGIEVEIAKSSSLNLPKRRYPFPITVFRKLRGMSIA